MYSLIYNYSVYLNLRYVGIYSYCYLYAVHDVSVHVVRLVCDEYVTCMHALSDEEDDVS